VVCSWENKSQALWEEGAEVSSIIRSYLSKPQSERHCQARSLFKVHNLGTGSPFGPGQ